MDALYDLVHQLATAQNIKLGMAPPPPPETHGVISRVNAFEQSLQRAAVVEPVLAAAAQVVEEPATGGAALLPHRRPPTGASSRRAARTPKPRPSGSRRTWRQAIKASIKSGGADSARCSPLRKRRLRSRRRKSSARRWRRLRRMGRSCTGFEFACWRRVGGCAELAKCLAQQGTERRRGEAFVVRAEGLADLKPKQLEGLQKMWAEQR